MGYCTWYEFSTKNNKYNVNDILDYMLSKEQSDDWFYAFSYEMKSYERIEIADDFELLSSDFCKWYSHDEEMLELSKQFPETVFCLHGEGEESVDLWNAYYKNGKKQFCPATIVYETYDESKLK